MAVNSSAPEPKVKASSLAALITTTTLAILGLFNVNPKYLVLASPLATVAVFVAGYKAPRSTIILEELADELSGTIVMRSDNELTIADKPPIEKEILKDLKDDKEGLVDLILSDKSVAIMKLAQRFIK